MKLKTAVIYAVAAVLCIGAGYGLNLLLNRGGTGYNPPLKILGDVQAPYTIRTMQGMTQASIEYNGKKVKALSLKSIVDKAKPAGSVDKVVLKGDDGLTAELQYDYLDGCNITLSSENGWEAVNFNHPPSSNIKRIVEIAVISKDPPSGFGLNIITPDKNISCITPGKLYLMDSILHSKFEGKSSVDRNGKVYDVGIYTSHKLVRLKDLASFNSQVLIMGDGGAYLQDPGDGYLELSGNSINYDSSDMEHIVKNVRGIMIDIPNRSVMDTYYDTQHYIQNGENVLIIYTDGFGYEQYLNAIKNNYAPNMKNLPAAEKASTVFIPVTNAGFAAMITGKDPTENGIYSRDQKDLKVPSIFAEVLKENKKALLVEGNIKILNTEVEPDLNTDTNSNGTNDDEIYADALKNINNGYSLMLVHFHSIDDSGHNHGILNQKTMDAIKTVDGYIGSLTAKWHGEVIIVSDHGMHSTQNGGDHGTFTSEDMIVPYIITQGGVK